MRSERKPWATLIVVALFGLTGKAGTITGLVRAQAKEGTDEASAGKYDSRKYKFAERINYAELRDFVVYVDQRATEKLATPPTQPVQVITTRRVSHHSRSFENQRLSSRRGA